MKLLSHSTVIHLPVEKINLYKWLINLSEKDYKSCSKAHRAIGLFKNENVEGMVNVENIGGNLLIQHYHIITKEKDNVFLRSKKSDAYFSHLIRVQVSVEWHMTVTYKDAQSCMFTCKIGTEYPNQVLAVAGKLAGVSYFMQKHLNGEAENFARNIESKFQ